MSTVNITITNIAAIRHAFNKAPAIMTKELNKAITRAVVGVERTSRLNTPVDTGRLRSSTYSRIRNLYGEVGTNTQYDIFVHEGTRFMRSRPYLRRAVESNQAGIDREFTAAVDRTLHEIGKMT